jgi:hypothetical protein
MCSPLPSVCGIRGLVTDGCLDRIKIGPERELKTVLGGGLEGGDRRTKLDTE